MEKKELDKLNISIYNCIYYTRYAQIKGRIRWSLLKSKWLKLTRGVSFEEIIQAKFLGIENNPNRANQKILVYEYMGYVWVVPFVSERKGIFLKTIYPSRKFKKIYAKRRHHEEDKIN